MILLVFLITFIIMGNNIFQKLYVEEVDALTGKIDRDDVRVVPTNIPNFGG